MYDTIIIGAGMSGLAAGIRLAHFNQRVCVLERHYTIGGLNSFYRLGGRDYDVGLHAVTNFTPKGAKKGPLARLLRQLRFKWEDFSLSPQIGSTIAFPDVQLQFGNGLELLEAEIAAKFPAQKDAFQQLLAKIIDYDDLDENNFGGSTRAVLSATISDPLLIEMLLCPLMWYGNAREHDMDFGQFCIMFRSIFMEGFARPFAGVRLILKNLVRRFRSLGGELKLRSGVERIKVKDGKAIGVVLDSGEELEGRRILSSAGLVETIRLCEDITEVDEQQAGQMSFTESISILDKQPKQLGFDRTIVFYNDSDTFHWQRPTDALCDMRTGVICSPNNYMYDESDGDLPDGVIRITTIADSDRWMALSEDEYKLEKLRWYDRTIASAVRFIPDFRGHVIDTDMFTPNTIRRFTWHDNGAVYGAPEKRLDGTTHLPNLFLCGTDQGFVGIIGSIVSGISIANQHCLRE
ncbi:MAG: NAD(P)/FAD-dependent oxidoreductase [Planctomycetaceae bacterium]|nr:NAD(P)/FAD-dependent oxidoreductase [Planctomycetales bacterium]MCB9875754.1 NAD(P)/FAD-dependent oxidoreductase [Planctomycetaceae bacterium]MCB9936891.1 NAD(P)/FAD-dependent oxidoreductase [Planctomycetaceae bacterium]